MLATGLRRLHVPGRPPLGLFLIRCLSSSTTVPLAYDLHTPSSASASTEGQSNGRPILFLHGLFGSKKNNRSISKALARDLRRPIYALDLRNHGESPHASLHDYVSMADDVAAFIRQHRLPASTIIGHSMGAKAAMTLALKSPELVHDVVSVDNAPVDAILESNFGKYVQGMKKIDEAGVTRQAEADAILKAYEPSAPVRQFLLGNLHRPNPPSTVQKFRVPLDIIGRQLGQMGDFPFKDPSAVRCDKPALFVRGTESRYVPDEVIPLIGQFFPRFRLVDVKAGHWLISENPEAFRQAVVDFLDDTDQD